MDRKSLLLKVLQHLDEALYLMERCEDKPDDEDAVWFAVNEAHSITEEQFNKVMGEESK